MYPSAFCGNEVRAFGTRDPRLLLIAILALTTELCTAGEWSGKAVFRNGAGLAGPNESHRVLNDNLLELGWETTRGLGWSLETRARLRYEDELERDPFRDFSIRQLVVSRETPDWSISLGKQDFVWGKMDAFPLLDVVNPRDVREFVLDDEARSRISVWAGSATYYWNSQSLQLVVVPDMETNRLPDPGGRFDLAATRLPAGVELRINTPNQPENYPKNWEAGVKWTGRAGPWELSSLVYHGWSNQPVYFTEVTGPTTLSVSPTSVRQTLIGVCGDVPYGSVVWRFEALHTQDGYRSFTDNADLPEQRKQSETHVAFGMDWTPQNMLAGWQVFQFENEGEAANLATPSGSYASAVLEKYWLQRQLKLRVFGMSALKKNDYLLTAELHYQFRGRYEFTIAGDWMGGNSSGFFGQFDDRDRLTVSFSIKL